MIPWEVAAMVLCSAIAVLVAYTKCPCTGAVDDPSADPSELPAR